MAQNDVFEEFISSINREPVLPQQDTVEEQSVVSNYLNPTIEKEEEHPRTSLETYQPKNIKDRSLGFQVFQGTYTLDDLEKNEEFQLRAERFMENINADEDIFEYLRDSDFSLSSAIVRAGQVKGWSQEAKEDYNYLRQVFDEADVGSTKQYMQLAKDVTVDLVRDPLNWLAAIFFVPSGGWSGAAGIAVKEATKMGFKQIAKEGLKGAIKPAKYAAAEGAAWTGAHDYFIQNADVELGMRDEINWGQTALTTGLGAGLGGIFGGAIGTVTTGGSLLRKKLSNYSDDVGIDKEVNSLSRQAELDDHADKKAVELIDDEAKAAKPKGKDTKKPDKEAVKRIKKRLTIIANTFGKPVAEFVEIARNSPKLQLLLGQFRSDWDKTLIKGVDKQAFTTYGEELNVRMFTYLTELRSTVGQLNRTNVDWSSWKGFTSTFKNQLDQTQNDHLVYLLRLNKKEFDEIITLEKSYKGVEKPTHTPSDEAAALSKRSLLDEDIDITFGGGYKTRNITDDLGKEISSEVIEAAARARDILNRIFNEASGTNDTRVFNGIGDIKLDLMSSPIDKVVGYFPRHFNFSKIMENRGKAGEGGFEDIIYRSEHSKPILEYKDTDKIQVINPETGDVVKDPITGKAQLYFPKSTQAVDEEVFGRYNFNKLKNLKKQGKHEEARKFKAKLIVDGMLEKRNQPFSFGHRDSTVAGSSYTQHRVFTEIDDRTLAPYLENSFEDVLEKYIMKSSRDITRSAFFGRDEHIFRARFIDPIDAELTAAGVEAKEIAKVKTKLETMYMRVTGLDAQKLRPEGWKGVALDWTKLSQQMAHLPLATLSSLTEPMIMLSRMDTLDGKMAASGQVGKALVRGVKKDWAKLNQFAARARGKEVKGFADMQDEHWQEAYKVGLAIEQGVMAHFEGLYGEAARGSWSRPLQNAFFKGTFLTSWTGAVQLAAFTTGKRLIRENAERLHLHKEGIKKLSKEKQEVLTEQLWDLGINEREATAWYKNSLDENNIFDEGRARGAKRFRTEKEKGEGKWTKNIQQEQFSFYENRLTKGANRFTREIILNPSTSEANRPLWFSHPAGQLLAQFAGYPTVFNNTILKRWSYETAEDVKRVGKGQVPQATGRILGTALSMTTVAVFLNALRSGGRSLEEEDETIILEAVQRWGGLGPTDILYRMQQNTTHGSGPTGTIIKALPGPIISDVVDAIAYRKGIPEMLATNTPFYSALPKEARDAWKKGARELNKQLTKGMWEDEEPRKYYTPASMYAKGGIVTNVPNASVEPDEKKVRGLPLTYAELGGVLAQDVEDRKGYVFGGLVNRILKINQVKTGIKREADDELIQYLTKDFRKAAPIFESNATTSLYKKQEAEEFANVEEEAIRYIDSDKLHDLEADLMYSNKVGVEVSTKPKKSGGKKLKQKGRLRLVRPLDLKEHYYELSPSNLSQDLHETALNIKERVPYWLIGARHTTLKEQLINKSPLPNEEAMKRLRTFSEDYKDTKKLIGSASAPVVKTLFETRQSFKLRELLTDLGYDSIKTKNGYTLFDNNQFRVTKKQKYQGFKDLEDQVNLEESPLGLYSKSFAALENLPDKLFQGKNKTIRGQDLEKHLLGRGFKKPQIKEIIKFALRKSGDDIETGSINIGQAIKNEMAPTFTKQDLINIDRDILESFDNLEVHVGEKDYYTNYTGRNADRDFDKESIPPLSLHFQNSAGYRQARNLMDGDVDDLERPGRYDGRIGSDTHFKPNTLSWTRASLYKQGDGKGKGKVLIEELQGETDTGGIFPLHTLKEPYKSNWDRYALLARFRETAKDADVGEIILTTPAHLESAGMQLNKNAVKQWYDPQKGQFVAAMKDIAKEFGGEVKYKKYPFMQTETTGDLLLSENSVTALYKMNEDLAERLQNIKDKNNITEAVEMDYRDYMEGVFDYDAYSDLANIDKELMHDLAYIENGFSLTILDFALQGSEHAKFKVNELTEMIEQVPFIKSTAKSLEGKRAGSEITVVDMVKEYEDIIRSILRDAKTKDFRPAAYIELTDEFRKNLLELPARMFKNKGGVVGQMNDLGFERK